MTSVRKRGKYWEYTISYSDKFGNYKRKSKSGFYKKKDALEAGNELEKTFSSGVFIPFDITLLDYISKWLKTYKLGKYSRVTEAGYRTMITQLKSYFGTKRKINSISRSEWQQFLNTFGKTHARSTVSKINNFVKNVVKSAVADQIIKFNFTEGAIISGKKSKNETLKYLQEADFKKLKDYVFKNSSLDKIYNYIIAVGILTGARYSEILALTWKDIDFSKKQIKIDKSWDYTFTQNFKATKTTSSRRIIDVDPELITLLEKLKQEQAVYFEKIQQPISINGMVFYDKHLNLLPDYIINKHLKRIEKELEIKPLITFHGLRHTHVSYLLSKGVDINYISHRLGHSNISITLRVYSHLLKEQKESEANKAVKVLTAL